MLAGANPVPDAENGPSAGKTVLPGNGERKVSNRAIVEKYDGGGVRRRFRNRALKFPRKKST
jgi:hypothetical protein